MRFMYMIANLGIRFEREEQSGNEKSLGKSYNRKTVYDRMIFINIVFLCIYAALTIFTIYGLITKNYYFTVDGDNSIRMGHFLSNYCLYLASLCSIHLWIYLARRFYIGLWDFREELGFDINPPDSKHSEARDPVDDMISSCIVNSEQDEEDNWTGKDEASEAGEVTESYEATEVHNDIEVAECTDCPQQNQGTSTT